MDDSFTPITPEGEHTPPQKPETKSKSAGPTVAIIVILLLLALGALYIIGGKVAERADDAAEEAGKQTPEEIAAEPDAARKALQNMSTSDELSAIETDLNATNLNGLDAEIGAISAELGP